MVKIKIALQRHGTEIELSTSTQIQVGNYVVVHAPQGHEVFGKFMTGQVLEVSEDLSKSEESFVQKIDTTYYDILQEEKAQSSRMKEVLDKIRHEKTVDEKLTILEATEPKIQDPLLEETKEEEGTD
jgi:hypothetical protein